MLNQHDANILKGCFLFDNNECNSKSLSDFLASDYCHVKEFSKGDIIFGADSSTDKLGILLFGKATALCSNDDKSSLKVFCEGELFGAASVFCEGSNSSFAKIKAVTTCRVFFITREGVERLICSQPAVAVKYIRFLCERVEFLNRRISTFTSNQAINRLCKYILDNSKQGVLADVNFAALARTLDISRASLYRARKELEISGAVLIGSKSITVLDENLLTVFPNC